MVGEIRDAQRQTCGAGRAHRALFSTLHTNDAPAAINRLMELGVPPI